MFAPLEGKLKLTGRELKETDQFAKSLYRRSKISLSRPQMGEISNSGDVGPNGEMPKSPKVQFHGKKLPVMPLVFIIFYEVSGGPFGVEDSVKAGGPLLALLGFLIFPIIWSIPESFVTAEMATMFPEDGGYVVWVSAAFGPFWGFQQGWWKWLSGVIDNALYPVLFLDYLKSAVPEVGSGIPRIVAILTITMALTYLNYRGLTIVGWAAVCLGIFSLLPFCMMAILAIPRLEPSRWLEIDTNKVDWNVYLNTLFWNLNYWDSVSTLAGEVDNPKHTLPKALSSAVVLVVSSYFIPLLAAIGSIEVVRDNWNDGYFADVAKILGGVWLRWWMEAAAALSNMGMFEAEMSSDSFQLLGMGERGMLPSVFAISGNQKLQGLQLSDCTINGDANVGLVGGSVSDKEGDQLINLEEVLEANVGPASIVREVYSYWLCKRVKKKGPLLQKFQQEQAAKRHDIFNQDSSGLMAYFGLKEDPTNMVAGYGLINIETVTQKLMGLQRELKQLRSISKQIIDRERVKAQLLSVVQKIAEMKLFVLQKNLGLMSCFSCKSSQNVLHCAYCMRIFCFECYKLWNGCGMKSYRILSCRSCICRDCGASKSEYLSHPSENVLRKPEMENRESLFSTEVSKGLVGCSRSDLACGSAPTKPHGEGRNKGSEVKNEPFSTHIANMVCSMPECTDSRTNCLLNPNMPKSHTTYSFSPLAAGTGPSEEIGGHPLEGKGRQWNPCKTVLLSELADVVGLSPGSLPVKSASSYCHNNVQRNRCKKKKIKSSDAIAVSS